MRYSSSEQGSLDQLDLACNGMSQDGKRRSEDVPSLRGVVKKGQSVLGRLLRENPGAWSSAFPQLYPGSINLYVLGDHHLFLQQLVAYEPRTRTHTLMPPPARRVACLVEGAAAWIIRTEFPERFFGPPGDHTMLEIVAPAQIPDVAYERTLSLEF